MVLFTAPEDMIIGTSIGLHEREVTAQQAVEDLRTTGRLLESAMDYLTEDEFNTKVMWCVCVGEWVCVCVCVCVCCM